MPTSSVDQKLMNEAWKLGHFKTKKETINTALREFIQRRKQLEIIELFGRFDPDQDLPPPQPSPAGGGS